MIKMPGNSPVNIIQEIVKKKISWKFRNIPTELLQPPQWLVWKHKRIKDKRKKPPVNPSTGRNLKGWQHSKNWLTFNQARTAFKANPDRVDGLGFFLTPDLGLVVIDIDHCISSDGDVAPEAWAAVQDLASYTELSPSGDGLHVWVKGTLPKRTNKAGNWEAYSGGQYLTMTGHRLPDLPETIKANQEALDYLWAAHFLATGGNEPRPEPAPPGELKGNLCIDLSNVTADPAVGPGAALTDDEILEQARAAKNGPKFQALWDGDPSGYLSQSEADMALCQILAFWSGRNPDTIDRLFRQSGLFRDKWNEKRGGERTYGTMTIEKAMTKTPDTYQGRTVGADGSTETPDYYADRKGLWWNKFDGQCFVPVHLSSFSARIVREVIRDDGGPEKPMVFSLEGKVQGRTHAFDLPANKFHAMTWPMEKMGASAWVMPGQSMKDRARTAVQYISRNVTRSEVFVHSGFRLVGDIWTYLHDDGGLGPLGPVQGIQTELAGPLARFEFPTPPAGDDLTKTAREVFEFFQALPPGLGPVLTLSPFRAVLSEADPPDVSPYFEGQTGAFKSELAAIIQSFFGQALADKRNLPASWSSTPNALERLSFLAKDALLTVDDFAPSGSAAEVSRLHAKAELVFRGAGNRSGRARLWADGTLRALNYPRGLVLGTGEDLPLGQSLRARLFPVEIKPGDVTSELLTRGQTLAGAGKVNALGAAFVQWTAARMDDLKKTYAIKRNDIRAALALGGHARSAGAVADFLTCAEVVRVFFQEAGVFDQTTGGAWVAKVRGELLTLAWGQADAIRAEDPTSRFFNLLSAALTGGRGHLVDAETGGLPEDPQLWGWAWPVGCFNTNPDEDARTYVAQGENIGWLDDFGDIYLDPDAVFAVVQKLGRDQGQSLPVTQGRLWKSLKAKGLLQSTEADRNQSKKKVEGTFRRVIHLQADQVFDRTGAESFQTAGTDQAEQEDQWETI